MSMPDRTNTSRRVLIAEDSPTQAQHLAHILESEGYLVSLASNGRLALEMARREKPRLIISDVIMPEMTGYELCSQIKGDRDLADVPVILVTTLSDPHDVIRGLECRADNFVLKPYDAEQLLRRIQFVLVNSEMRQSEQPGMGLEIVSALSSMSGDKFDPSTTWRLFGTTDPIERVRKGEDPASVSAKWTADEARWRRLRAKYLIYR